MKLRIIKKIFSFVLVFAFVVGLRPSVLACSGVILVATADLASAAQDAQNNCNLGDTFILFDYETSTSYLVTVVEQ